MVEPCSPTHIPESIDSDANPDPMTSVMMNLLEEIVDDPGQSLSCRCRARTLSNHLYRIADEIQYMQRLDSLLEIPDMVRLLRLGMELRGTLPMAGYYEEVRVDLGTILRDWNG